MIRNRFDRSVFYFSVIDILFLPYLRFIYVSASMLILLAWYSVSLKKIRVGSEIAFFYVLAGLAVIGTLVSVLSFPEIAADRTGKLVNVWLSNFVYFTLLIYTFLYYFFFKHCLIKYDFKIKKLLILYVIFNLSLATVFFLRPALYFELRSYWTMSGHVITHDEFSHLVRFTGAFNDPNNASVMLSAVVAFLVFNQTVSLWVALGITLVAAFVILNTMSATGTITFFVCLLASSFYVFRGLLKRKKAWLAVATSVALALFSLPIVYEFLPDLMTSEVTKSSLDRIENSTLHGRLEIWKHMLSSGTWINSLVYGSGGTIMQDGVVVRPHSGHLYLIYGYGIVSYLIFIYVFFRIRWALPYRLYIFAIPIFIGFTVNVGLYDFRFSALMALLVASYAAHDISSRPSQLHSQPLPQKTTRRGDGT